MTEDDQLHLEIVVQRRVRKGEDGKAPVKSPEADRAAAAAEQKPEQSRRSAADGGRVGQSASHGGRSGAHRRHYADYGTLNLGTIEDPPADKTERVQIPASASYGENQRAFFDKYDAVLKRNYATRNRSKVTKILMVAAIALIVFTAMIVTLIKNERDEEGKILEPVVETIPVVPMDLGQEPIAENQND